ncbi:MAG: hypothetical protein ACOH10_13760 [Rhodoglobus sp.]
MARAPISIGIASDAKQFLSGIKSGVIAPLEEVKDTFDDVAKSGDRAGDKLEDSLSGAQRETKQLRKEYDKLGDDIQSASRRGRTSMVNDSNAATTRGKQNINELGNEAKANLAETLSSFDGTVEGTISGIQGTLGGVTAGLTGVIPIIAAAAGAAGLGLIAVAFEKQSEQAELVRQKVSELASELIETGGIGERSIDSMVDALKTLASETDEGAKSLSDIRKAAKDAGLEFSDIAQAYVGNSKALKEQIKLNEKHADVLRDEADALQTGIDGYSVKVQALDGARQKTNELNDTLRTNLEVTQKAEKAERDYLASGAVEMERKAALVGTINDAYDDAAGSVEDFINKESGLFDVKAYIKSMEARSKALADYQKNLAEADLTPEAKAFLNEQGAEAAASFLAGYKKATPAQKAALNKIWTEAAKTDSGTYKKGLENGLKGNVKGPKVVPTVDTNAVQKELNKRVYSVTIGAPRLSQKAV